MRLRRRVSPWPVALVVVLAAAAPATGSASDLQVTARTQIDPRLVDLTMQTPALDFPIHVRVLLPDGYAAARHRRYPVLYLLHGSFDTSAGWTDRGDAEAITAGQPLIVVMPPTAGKGNAGGWASDWSNEGRGGPPKWETFFAGELIPWVDAHLRTVARRDGRAVAGLSMGGFSSMSWAARHPDLFTAAASFSGAVDTNYPPVWPVIQLETSADGGATPDAIWGPRASEELAWRAHNPWDLAENMRGMTLSIYTGSGQQPPGSVAPPDPIEYGVHDMSVSLHERLDALGEPHLFDDYGPGTHSWPYWQRDLRSELPRIMAAFAAPRRASRPFTYVSADPVFSVYGWSVTMHRSVGEFATLAGASARGFTLRGSGSGTVVTAPRFKRRARYRVVVGRVRRVVRAGRDRRLRVEVPLGPSNTGQQFRPGTTTHVFSTRVIIRRAR